MELPEFLSGGYSFKAQHPVYIWYPTYIKTSAVDCLATAQWCFPFRQSSDRHFSSASSYLRLNPVQTEVQKTFSGPAWRFRPHLFTQSNLLEPPPSARIACAVSNAFRVTFHLAGFSDFSTCTHASSFLKVLVRIFETHNRVSQQAPRIRRRQRRIFLFHDSAGKELNDGYLGVHLGIPCRQSSMDPWHGLVLWTGIIRSMGGMAMCASSTY